MHQCRCCHGWRVFHKIFIFVLRLPAQPPQGWLARRILLPYVYTCLWRRWLLPWDFFNKLTPWIFDFSVLSAMSDLDTLRIGAILRTRCLVGTLCNIEGSHYIVTCLWRFQRGSEVVWVTWGFCFRTTWYWGSVPILLAISLLSPGLIVRWSDIG